MKVLLGVFQRMITPHDTVFSSLLRHQQAQLPLKEKFPFDVYRSLLLSSAPSSSHPRSPLFPSPLSPRGSVIPSPPSYIPAESFGTPIFLTSHQCIMLFYISLRPSTMVPLGERTLSFFFNIVMGAQGGYSGNECFGYKYRLVK